MKFKASAWWEKWFGSANRLLRQTRGIIHVGGNAGQERFMYAHHDLCVVWVEPVPRVFDQLCDNLRIFPKQRAFRNLITDKDGHEYKFYISNNGGQSSSIFPFEKHKEMWPDVAFEESIILVSTTLSTFVTRECLDLAEFDTLVLDTQGSELLVLQGATDILSYFRFVVTEVADFDSYRGGCRIKDVDDFLAKFGFSSKERKIHKSVPGLGAYYDVTYER